MNTKNVKSFYHQNRIDSQSGLTLIELLVALALGLLLAGIMGTMYLSSKVSFTASTQVARAQENLRFSSYFLQRDLRESAYSECGSGNPTTVQLNIADPNYFVEATNSGLMGWDYAGTDQGDTFDLSYTSLGPNSTNAEINSARTANTAAASQWENNSGTDLPTLIQSLSPLLGSDIIMVSSERRTSAILGGVITNTNPDISINDNGAGLMQGQILKVGTCAFMDKFQNVSTDPSLISTGTGAISGFSPGNAATYTSSSGQPWSASHPLNASVFTESTKVFYIGTGSGGIPSLYRYSSDCGLAALASGCSENVELTEGVENMQVFYGEDTDNDEVANFYRSADNVVDFDNVVSMRVSLLLRSTQESEVVDTNDYDLSDTVTINPDDLRLIRFVNNNTIHLRNRGI